MNRFLEKNNKMAIDLHFVLTPISLQLILFLDIYFIHSQNIAKTISISTLISNGKFLTPFHFKCDTPPEWFSEYPKIHSGLLWPNGRVTYQLHPDLTNMDIEHLTFAFKEFFEKTCIRFERRVDPDQKAFLSIEKDSASCSLGHFCYKGGYQFIKFSSQCSIPGILIHQLGHTLCLTHEHERPDRDEFVDFSHCPKDEVPPKNNYDTKGYPYDFASKMHNQCGQCVGGRSKMKYYVRCGLDVGKSLGVLDADKINELYGCQGCFRHRWRSTANLTPTDIQAMIPFGYNHDDNQPLYLCRAYVEGEITAGKYRQDQNICYVAYKYYIYQIKENVQVFTLPLPNSTTEAIMQRGRTYRTVPSYLRKSTDKPVPVGRAISGLAIFAAVATVGDPGSGSGEVAIGRVYDGDRYATFAYDNKMLRVRDFDVLVCSKSA